jgi:hypothetical protein
MEVTVPHTLNILNGSDARLSCTFNSCYTVNHKQFSLNWTYQECSNCSEEMVSLGNRLGETGPCKVKSAFPTPAPTLGHVASEDSGWAYLLQRAWYKACCHT